MFLLKYKVQDLENELIAKQAQIVRDRGEIRVLDAEWTYLNDPGRLRRLSEEYLGFGPPVPQNVTDIDALPFRNAPTAYARRRLPAPATPLRHRRAEAAPPAPTIDAEMRRRPLARRRLAFERPSGLSVLLPVFSACCCRWLLGRPLHRETSAMIRRRP